MRGLLLLAAVGAALAAASGQVPAPALGLGATTALALGLLACSAFFSGSETALFSLQPLDRRALTDRGRAAVERLLDRPRRTLASLLIGNEVVNVSLSIVTAGLIFQVAPDKPWLNVLLLTPVLLVFGEVMPKTVAFRFNRAVAPRVAPLVWGFSRLVAPLRVLLSSVADAAVRVTGGEAGRRETSLREQQLRMLLDKGRESGTIRAMEREVIGKVFAFSTLSVGRVMTPRPDIFMVSVDTAWPLLLTLLRDQAYSRVPVWEGSPDNVIGVLFVKDLLPSLLQPGEALGPRQIRKLLRPARFVPTTRRAGDMLDEFRAQRFHLALVVDEHGSVVGLVTLDDLLRELVGELRDENDALEPMVRQTPDGVCFVNAGMNAEAFARRFGLDLPEGDYHTAGGLVIAHLGELPRQGDQIQWNGLRIGIERVQGRRVLELRVDARVLTPLPEAPGEEDRP